MHILLWEEHCYKLNVTNDNWDKLNIYLERKEVKGIYIYRIRLNSLHESLYLIYDCVEINTCS